MTIKELIKELQKYPQDCEVGTMSGPSDYVGFVEDIEMRTDNYSGITFVVLKEL